MSSSVFFRFKSQKEPARVAFDGTGISVFDLKREIITLNRLGDGTDFELLISSEGGDEVYDDDTTIIARGTTVIAKRLPALRPGRGGAARYVSGKMPNHSNYSHRAEPPSKAASKGKGSELSLAPPDMIDSQTEEQRIEAIMKYGADQWAQQEKEMANATPAHRGPIKGRSINVPDRPPPPSYICYRCGEKGHYIQVCPTNNDPAYDGRPRLKRTTGIPRAFLRTVERPSTVTNDGSVDDTKQPAGVMVNADGDWVVAEPDNASWEQFQAKAKVSEAAQKAADLGSKELKERGLECTIDKRLFVEPTKTPCCGATFCHDCITNSLLENDLTCPKCSTDNILIDSLIPDEEMTTKLRAYDHEKEAADREKERPKTRSKTGSPKSPKKASSTTPTSTTSSTSSSNSAKKRRADTDLPNQRTAPGRPVDTLNGATKSEPSSQQARAIPKAPLDQFVMPTGMNALLPNQMGYMMGGVLPMDPTIWSTMMMQDGSGSFMGGGAPGWDASFNFYAQQTPNLANLGFQNGIMPNGGYSQQTSFPQMRNGPTGMAMGMGSNNRGLGTFSNQQRNTFSAPMVNEEDSAYFRKPVNPHRHQARRNVNRPTDYREI